jgi:GDP-D-mannose dehydratase
VAGSPRALTCPACPSKARGKLGWEPRYSFREQVAMMVGADLEQLSDTVNQRELA